MTGSKGVGRDRGRAGALSLLAAIVFGLAGADGCGSNGPDERRHVDTYVLPTPKIVVATEKNCAPFAEPPVVQDTPAKLAQVAANRFTVEIPVAAGTMSQQKGDMYCWAACTQTLLKQEGIESDQLAMAKQFLPENGDQSATVGVIIRALNPDLEQRVEAGKAIPADMFGTTSDQLLQELMAGQLCVVGLEQESSAVGHAYVVRGATFSLLKPSGARVDIQASGMGPHAVESLRTAADPKFGLCSVDLLDPWDGTPATRSGEEFRKQACFIIDRRYARDMLVDALKRKPGEKSSYTLSYQDRHSTRRSTGWSGPGGGGTHSESSWHS